MTFNVGIPDFRSLIVTPFGPCQLTRFHENGNVDLNMGGGRNFTVPGSTTWRYAR